MPQRIVIIAGDLELPAELHDSPTARAIAAALPLEGQALTWGDEIYFPIPVTAELDDTARDRVEIGDVGYWPQGKALCLFFGPTPVSGPGEIRPASAVNLVGQILGEATRLKAVPAGIIIKVKEAS